ncbi:helix-turn-helix domain-containing protein [Amycolatopsis alba]|uniref:DNA-binding protein n=1 Tax=Amycolatopsis alba DSM 44262 TaxID=1125972 RepID=A0A229RZQ3_AMYAL|nr:helix-turn-helix domain-containing protein [Amycolatopsis alba]OXM52001.1 DNA-binding protein [Amycolatopsis alba DSM 44262]
MVDSAQLLPVARAAQVLDISRERVRELVHGGRLDAVRIGRELLVDARSVEHRKSVVKPAAGRPLSARMAWGFLWSLSGHRPSWISPSERVRLNRYAQEREPAQWPRLLSGRARVYRVRMLAGPLARLREDPQAVVSGPAAAGHYGADLLAGSADEEFYVDAVRFDELTRSRRLRLGSAEPNAVIRVPALSDVLRPPGSAGFAIPAAVAADLLDAGDERSVVAAQQLLTRLGEVPKLGG